MKRKKELNVIVGANIKREREKAGYTQDQFSELFGIGSKSLSCPFDTVNDQGFISMTFQHTDNFVFILQQHLQQAPNL